MSRDRRQEERVKINVLIEPSVLYEESHKRNKYAICRLRSWCPGVQCFAVFHGLSFFVNRVVSNTGRSLVR